MLGWLTHSTMPPASYLLALKLNPHLSFLKLGLGSSCASYSKLPWQLKGSVGGGRVRVAGFGGKGLARCVPTTCGEGLHMPSYNHVISISPLYFFKLFLDSTRILQHTYPEQEDPEDSILNPKPLTQSDSCGTR